MNNNTTVTTTKVVGKLPDTPKAKSAPPLATQLKTLKLGEIDNRHVLAFIESDGKLLPGDAPLAKMAAYCLDNGEPGIFRALMKAVHDQDLHVPDESKRIEVNNAKAASTLADAAISCPCLDRFQFMFKLSSLSESEVLHIASAISSNCLMQNLAVIGGFESSVSPKAINTLALALSGLPELRLSWNLDAGSQADVRACESVRDAIGLATNITSFDLGNCWADAPEALLQAIVRLGEQKQLARLNLYYLSPEALSRGYDVLEKSATITDLSLGSLVNPAKLAQALQASPCGIESLHLQFPSTRDVDASPILDVLSTRPSIACFSMNGGSVGSKSLIKLVGADTKLHDLTLRSVVEMDERAAGKLLAALENNSGLVLFQNVGNNDGGLPQDKIDVVLRRNKQRALRYTESFVRPSVIDLVKDLPNDLKEEGGPLGEELPGTWETPNQRFQNRGVAIVDKTTHNAAVDARANDLGRQLTDMLVAHNHRGMANLIMTAFDAGIAIDPAALRLIAKNSQVPLVLTAAMRLNGAAQVLQEFAAAGADMDSVRKSLSKHCSKLAPQTGIKWYPGQFVEFCAGLIRCGDWIDPKHLSLYEALTVADPSTKLTSASKKTVLDLWATSSTAAALYIDYHVPPVTEEGKAKLESDLWTWCTKSKNYAPMLVLANDPRISRARFDCASAKPELFLQKLPSTLLQLYLHGVGNAQAAPVAAVLSSLTAAGKLELRTTCTGDNFKLMLAALATAMGQNKKLEVKLVLSGMPTSKKAWPDFQKKYGDRVTVLIQPQ